MLRLQKRREEEMRQWVAEQERIKEERQKQQLKREELLNAKE